MNLTRIVWIYPRSYKLVCPSKMSRTWGAYEYFQKCNLVRQYLWRRVKSCLQRPECPLNVLTWLCSWNSVQDVEVLRLFVGTIWFGLYPVSDRCWIVQKRKNSEKEEILYLWHNLRVISGCLSPETNTWESFAVVLETAVWAAVLYASWSNFKA